MEVDLPRLPQSTHYSNRWKLAKKKFKETTGKKKPAPTVKTKAFSDKITLIEKRQGTGIDKSILALEKVLPNVFKGENGQAAYEKAYGDFETKMNQYVLFLETAIKTAPGDVNPQTWKSAVTTLKVEVKRIKHELRAYLDKAKQSERAQELSRQMADNMFDGMGPLIVTAEKWVLARMEEKQVNDQEFTGNGMTHARNITQRLMNINKLPILVGGWQSTRGPVPDEAEDTLEDFANGRRSYNNWNEYVRELNDYRLALIALREWLNG